MDESEVKRTIELFVDYLFRNLDAYEASLYLFLLRKTVFMTGKSEIRLGKRTLQSGFVRGARGGGRANAGGLWVNYSHITKILHGLEKKGCIKIGDTTREGTLYTVLTPQKIPSVIKALSASRTTTEFSPEDYFHDSERRNEIFERDGYRCQYCGEPVSETNATLDHYVPQSIGGGHDKSNLRTSCLLCNSIKSGRTFDDAAPQLLKSISERKAKQIS